MGGSSLQFLLTLILLFLLCMKPTTGNNLGLANTHLGCKEHERQALLKIKQDLIDDYGHLSSWSSDQDCCKWSGVRCSNQTGHVIMLNLNVSSFLSRPLRGEIPTGPQLNTFNATSYEANSNLCGFPLPNRCSGEEMTQNSVKNRGSEHAGVQEEEDGFITMGFYVSMAFGVVVGFWGVFGTILLNRSWRFSYFKFLNIVKDKMYVTGAVDMVKSQRRLQT